MYRDRAANTMDHEEQERISTGGVSGKKPERMNIRFGEKDTEIIMDAYMRNGEQDWKAVLRQGRKF